MSKKLLVNVVSIAYHSELDAMKDQYTTDDALSRIYDQLVEGQRHDHYTLRDGFLMMHGKLCVTQSLHHKVLTESHSSPYAGHRGIDATMKAIEHYFYQPTLRKDVEELVRTCITCQKAKHDRQKLARLLQPLPIPDRP